MRACDHLLDRAGGKVYMDNTFASAALKDVLQAPRHVIKRLHIYLKHDMVRTKSLPKHLIKYIFNISFHKTYAIFYFRSSFQSTSVKPTGIWRS